MLHTQCHKYISKNFNSFYAIAYLYHEPNQTVLWYVCFAKVNDKNIDKNNIII